MAIKKHFLGSPIETQRKKARAMLLRRMTAWPTSAQAKPFTELKRIGRQIDSFPEALSRV
jgi:hypothetical protein